MTLEEAFALAFVQLNRRERTVHEMRQHLLARGVDAPVVEEVLQDLTVQGYLDDVRFSRLFVQDKRTLSQWGGRRIRQALLERGVPAEVVQTALREAPEEGLPAPPHRPPDPAVGHQEERRRALDVLARRFPDGLADRPSFERALGVLLRKGYEYELALDALTEYRRQTRLAS